MANLSHCFTATLPDGDHIYYLIQEDYKSNESSSDEVKPSR